MPSCRTCARSAGCFFVFWVKGTVYILWCGQISDYGWFFPAFGSHLRCGHEPLPPNQTGLKVLTIGIAKTGTRTMARSMYELGLNSYHSEDLLQFVWHPLARDYWAKPENGGYLQPPIAVVYSGGADRFYDEQVLAGTPNFPEVWAEGVSRCRVHAVVFDATEKLIWTTIDSSPDAKVLVSDWRTYAEWRRSQRNYLVVQWIWILLFVDTNLGLHFLPWNIFYHITEPLFNWPIKRMFATGDPPLNQFQTPMQTMFLRHYSNGILMAHLYGGLGYMPGSNETEYEAFWESVRKRVPPERRMRVDPRKTTYEDLCAFLELSPCKKSGRLGKPIDVGPQGYDFFPAIALLMPIWMVVHWVNWQLLHWVCGHLKQGAKGALALLGAR